ncbi:MAG: hypothetical protein E7543_05710 [Ruminococcaceae bacterium]|nr:hypothetical protein [Oscillospiraceae bacterium]
MSRFIVKPNLPEGEVSALVCGRLNGELTDYFRRRNIELIFTNENGAGDKAVSTHADLSVLYLGQGRIIADRGQPELTERLNSLGLNVTESRKRVEGAYPDDCILNHTIAGKYIIGNSKIFDLSVKALTENLEIIPVNQGYCKCSVLVVDEGSLITDDESIARNAAEKGLDCLLIGKGDIFLEGHGYGFIGGASGKLSRDEVVFFGNITQHRDYGRIKAFLDKRGIRIISFDFPLTDFGGIIPLKENIF